MCMWLVDDYIGHIDKIASELIGTASAHVKAGEVICASFHAG